MRLMQIFSVSLLFISSSVVFAQGNLSAPVPAAEPAKECAAQVQKFYTIYLKRNQDMMNGIHKGSSAQDSLKADQPYYTPELFQAMKDDLDASSKSSGEIVGLDFDPVLNT